MKKSDYFIDTPKGWNIQQVLLDNLALGEGIPLRIVKLEELKQLYKHFLEADAQNEQHTFKQQFPTQEDFDNFSLQVTEWFLEENSEKEVDQRIFSELKILKKLYENFSQQIFPVLPGYLHSLEFLAQTMVKYWRIYSLLWLYQRLVSNIKLTG